MLKTYFDFREQWLVAAGQEITPIFEAAGYKVPDKIKVSCGWSAGQRGSKRVLGVAVHQSASTAANHETFISPVLDDPLTVLRVLMHEYVHHVVGVEAGHGPKFRAACKALGLEGKATEALPGEALTARLRDEVLPILGAYPHASVDPHARKKQGTRMVKLVCPVSGYTVRTTKKWIAEGLPVSPAGYTMEVQGDDNEAGE